MIRRRGRQQSLKCHVKCRTRRQVRRRRRRQRRTSPLSTLKSERFERSRGLKLVIQQSVSFPATWDSISGFIDILDKLWSHVVMWRHFWSSLTLYRVTNQLICDQNYFLWRHFRSTHNREDISCKTVILCRHFVRNFQPVTAFPDNPQLRRHFKRHCFQLNIYSVTSLHVKYSFCDVIFSWTFILGHNLWLIFILGRHFRWILQMWQHN